MATLADLRKRLRGIQTICQLAGAMRTVSSAKLARINASAYAFSAYAQGCRELLEASGAVISISAASRIPAAEATPGSAEKIRTRASRSVNNLFFIGHILLIFDPYPVSVRGSLAKAPDVRTQPSMPYMFR